MNSATGIDSQPEIALEERNMEMKNSAYNQEKLASAPPLPLSDQETERESNQGISRNLSPQLCATTSLYQTAVIQDAQEVGVCEKEYFSSFFNEK
jgi:hypothetical protein